MDVDGKGKGAVGTCQFPFTYQGKTYDECASQATYGGVGWCAFDSSYKSQRWGYCTSSCPGPVVCQSQQMTVKGKGKGGIGICNFPFTYKGKTYDACADVAMYGGVGWCAFDDNYQSGRWAYCTAGCPGAGGAGGYKLLNSHFCTGQDKLHQYKSWELAKKGCDQDRNCKAIYDYGCNGEGAFTTCKSATGRSPSSTNSCMHQKPAGKPAGKTHRSCPPKEHNNCCKCVSDEGGGTPNGDWDNGKCCGHCTAMCRNTGGH